MNDELQLTEEELESMADKLIEQAAGADIAEQQETELIKAPRKSSKKKEQVPDNRPPEERLKELFEKGRKAGKLTAKDLELLNELNLEAEAIDRFYEELDKAGMTEAQAQDSLRAAFRTIIPDADVKLALYNKYFSVIGDAHAGQYYIYKEKMNIFQALAMTGDVMNSGDRRHIRIVRPKDFAQEPEVLEFDIRTNSIIDSKYYYVYPNDVIYVARTKNSFYTVQSYAAFTGLITSSVALLTTVLNYVALVYR